MPNKLKWMFIGVLVAALGVTGLTAAGGPGVLIEWIAPRPAPPPSPPPAAADNAVISPELRLKFDRIADQVMQVVNQHTADGIEWTGKSLRACGSNLPCAESYLRVPFAIVTAPSDPARRRFALALVKALMNSGVEGVNIQFDPSVRIERNPSCSPEEVKLNLSKCFIRQTLSPWSNYGFMSVQFAELRGLDLDTLTDKDMDIRFKWRVVGSDGS